MYDNITDTCHQPIFVQVAGRCQNTPLVSVIRCDAGGCGANCPGGGGGCGGGGIICGGLRCYRFCRQQLVEDGREQHPCATMPTRSCRRCAIVVRDQVVPRPHRRRRVLIGHGGGSGDIVPLVPSPVVPLVLSIVLPRCVAVVAAIDGCPVLSP